MTKHTPTPWKVEQRQGQEFYMLTHGEIAVLRTYGDSKGDIEDIVHARICVNACAGINPSAVEDLRSVLTNALEWWGVGRPSPTWVVEAHAALAKAKLP